MVEKPIGPSPTQRIIGSVFSSSEEMLEFNLNAAKEPIAFLTHNERTHFLISLVNGIAKNADPLQRNRALKLLPLVNFNRKNPNVDIEIVMTTYLEAVFIQDGTDKEKLKGLQMAGKIITPILSMNPQARSAVNLVWSELAEKIEDNKEGYADIKNFINEFNNYLSVTYIPSSFKKGRSAISILRDIKEKALREKYMLGDLLAAIGNHEGKALLLAAMETGIPYTEADQRRLLDAKGMQVGRGIPFEWCTHSLAPMGLVAKSEGIAAYEKTAYGEEMGTALAGHLLSFSLKHPEISLYKLFGPTHSSAKDKTFKTKNGTASSRERSPLTRYEIFYQLLHSSLPIHKAALIKSITGEDELSHVLNNHLDLLGKFGIITYETIESNKGYTRYALSEQKTAREPTLYRKGYPKQVYEILKEHPDITFSVDALYDELIARYPKIALLNKRFLKNDMANALNDLSRQGYLIKGNFNSGSHSEISLSEGQKLVLTDIVNLLDRFSTLDQSFLEKGRDLSQDILSSPHAASTLMEKAYSSSPNVRTRGRDETMRRIEAIISDTFLDATSRDIQKLLQEVDSHVLGLGTITGMLKDLEREGKITITKVGAVNHYSSKNEKEQHLGESETQNIKVDVYIAIQYAETEPVMPESQSRPSEPKVIYDIKPLKRFQYEKRAADLELLLQESWSVERVQELLEISKGDVKNLLVYLHEKGRIKSSKISKNFNTNEAEE